MTRTAEQEGDVYLSFFLTCSFPHSVSSAADILPLGRPLQPLPANRKWLSVQWWELPVTPDLFAATPMTNNGLSDTAAVFINAGKHHCCCYYSYLDVRRSNKPQALGVFCWGKVCCSVFRLSIFSQQMWKSSLSILIFIVLINLLTNHIYSYSALYNTDCFKTLKHLLML